MPTPIAATEHLNKLKAFRQAAYQQLGPSRDALFELTDAILLTPALNSFAELSLCPAFRRRWPSLYETVQDSRPDRLALLDQYLRELPLAQRLIVMGDHTAWPRLKAKTLRERTVEHQPNSLPGARPITVGQGYSTLAWVPEAHGSWALPLLHERISSAENPLEKAVAQLRTLCAHLPGSAARPLALFDAEYGCAPFVNASADLPCDKLFRLRSNLCLRGAPPPYRGRGRPAKHGRKFKLTDARTWGKPLADLQVDDLELGPMHLRLWPAFHFKKAAGHPLWIVRLERCQAQGTRRDPHALWLGWLGDPPPPLSEWWKTYLRRFAGDHWYRFAKQSLYWTLPRFKTPEQAEHWSDLMPLVTWELWLARPLIADKTLPWQKPMRQLSPGRVRQSLGAIFEQIGTPAQPPKPRGKSNGWPTGCPRQRAVRYAVVKKARRRRS
ncbi:MAG: hypothetical protein HY238_01250 [Acidobacteria bacterium]|nr:hypothetical protein [Acidobacteriota bacterium]